MTHDDHLLAQIRNIDLPVDPDPTFAGALEQQFLAEAGVARQPIRLIPAQPVRVDITKPGLRRRGRRLLDLAAVAVLLLSMIGGLARSTTTGGDPGTPTIEAPDTSRTPVMIGGSAAGDRQYSGPAPAAERYDLAWEFEGSTEDSFWPVLTFGETVYTLRHPGNPGDHPSLIARNLTTGAEIWEAIVSPLHGFAVTPMGVVVAVETPTGGTGYDAEGNPSRDEPIQIALLDLETGRRIWTTEETWGNDGERGRSYIIVDQIEVWFADGFGYIVELDLVNGAVNWSYSYERVFGAGLNTDICFPGSDGADLNCFDRHLYPIHIAAAGDTVNFGDELTGQVAALARSDGSLRWTVDVASRSPERTFISAFAALGSGLSIILNGPSSSLEIQASYLGVWGATDGAELWSSIDVYDPWIVFDGDVLMVQQRPAAPGETTCCVVRAFDPETGSIPWSATNDGSSLAGYLTETDQILFNEYSPLTADIGINGETFAEDWYFRYFQDDCQPIYPLPDNGYVVCSSQNYGLRVLRPVVEPEASPVASPVPRG